MAVWLILCCPSYSITAQWNIEKQEQELGSSAINICIHGLPPWGKKSLPSQEEFPNE